MNIKQFAGILVIAGCALLLVAGAGALAQSNRSPDLSKEWPTYGHDPGGMRFSPLTQITPANVSQLKVAWTYHMKPEGFTASAPAFGRRGAGGGEVEGADAPQGRRGGRGGSNFRSSTDTPLAINGVMYISSPYNRIAALDS